MSKLTPRVNFAPKKELWLALNLKELSPIRKVENDIETHMVIHKESFKIGESSPLTPGTLPNSIIASQSLVEIKADILSLEDLNILSKRISNLEQKMKENLWILERKMQKNHELNKIVETLNKKVEKKNKTDSKNLPIIDQCNIC